MIGQRLPPLRREEALPVLLWHAFRFVDKILKRVYNYRLEAGVRVVEVVVLVVMVVEVVELLVMPSSRLSRPF